MSKPKERQLTAKGPKTPRKMIMKTNRKPITTSLRDSSDSDVEPFSKYRNPSGKILSNKHVTPIENIQKSLSARISCKFNTES